MVSLGWTRGLLLEGRSKKMSVLKKTWGAASEEEVEKQHFQQWTESFLMRTLGTLPSLRISRNPLVALAWSLVVVFAAYEAAEAILANDMTSLAFAALLFVGAAVFVAILNDWRRGLYLLVAWILFEDFVRKYLGNNMAIYFA